MVGVGQLDENELEMVAAGCLLLAAGVLGNGAAAGGGGAIACFCGDDNCSCTAEHCGGHDTSLEMVADGMP
jgi:hypothetical protein